MEGWDEEHMDQIYLIQTPQNKYLINGYVSFGEFTPEGSFETLDIAMENVIKIMEEWDDNN